MIVEIVEPDFSPGDDPWMFGEFCQLMEMLGSDFFRFVWMDAHRRVNPIVLFGKRNSGIEFLRPRAGTDGEKRRHARGVRTFEHGFAIVRKLREVNVGVRVDEFHSMDRPTSSARRFR